MVGSDPKGVAFIQERLSPALTAISQYLETYIKRGKIRDLDPTLVTVALMMTALTHAQIVQLIDKNKPLLNHLEKNRAQARFWLELLAPMILASASSVAAIEAANPG